LLDSLPMRWERYTGLSGHRKRLELASTRRYLCPSRQCALRHWIEGHHSAVRFRVRTNGIWTILGISTTVPVFGRGIEVPGLSLRVIDFADVWIDSRLRSAENGSVGGFEVCTKRFRSMIVYRCDICHEVRECSQREIEQAEYDVCSECWEALAFKLKGKGRPKRQAVIIQPAPAIPEPTGEPKQPFPGAPPTIYASADRLN
jgi:hypothetical protein